MEQPPLLVAHSSMSQHCIPFPVNPANFVTGLNIEIYIILHFCLTCWTTTAVKTAWGVNASCSGEAWIVYALIDINALRVEQ